MSPGHPGAVLLVEDSDSDIYFFRQALSAVGLHLDLQVVSNGLDAIAYIEGSGPYSDRAKFPSPDLILLDLKIPKKYGLEILEWLASQPKLRNIPVVVLTSSSQPGDIRKAYGLGIRHYVVKPVGMAVLKEFVEAIVSYLADSGGGTERYLKKFESPRPKSAS
jgi:CheY-like chemotaxis protein